jgi:hypothetical protein
VLKHGERWGRVVLPALRWGHKLRAILRLESSIRAIIKYWQVLNQGNYKQIKMGLLDPLKTDLIGRQKEWFPNYKYRDRISMYYNNDAVLKENPLAGGFTSDKLINGKYEIYFGNRAYRSAGNLYLSMGHEFIHVGHFIEFPNTWKEKLSEYAANYWDYKYCLSIGAKDNANYWLEQANSYYKYDLSNGWDRFFKGMNIFNYMKYESYGIPGY